MLGKNVWRRRTDYFLGFNYFLKRNDDFNPKKITPKNDACNRAFVNIFNWNLVAKVLLGGGTPPKLIWLASCRSGLPDPNPDSNSKRYLTIIICLIRCAIQTKLNTCRVDISMVISFILRTLCVWLISS